jgi:hypothetical protein
MLDMSAQTMIALCSAHGRSRLHVLVTYECTCTGNLKLYPTVPADLLPQPMGQSVSKFPLSKSIEMRPGQPRH